MSSHFIRGLITCTSYFAAGFVTAVVTSKYFISHPKPNDEDETKKKIPQVQNNNLSKKE